MSDSAAKAKRPKPMSADCRKGHHSFCSGSTYAGPMSNRTAGVARCHCRCHG